MGEVCFSRPFDSSICVHLRFSRLRLLGIHSRLALLLPDFMTGKGISSLFYRSTLAALMALATLTVFLVFALTLRGQNAPATPTPSTTPSPSPSPKTKASPAPTRPAPPPKPYATGYGKPWPSPSPSPSVQLAPDLIPDPQHVPVPTPPPPATNDLLPENKPVPTPVGPQPSEPDLLPSTPTPGPSPAGSATPHATPPLVTSTSKKLEEQVLKEKMRFRQIESAAERDPHAIELWNTANQQYTMEYRREWQRLYYVYVCDMMRKLDPSLKELVDSWEQTHLSAESSHNIRPTVPRKELRGAAETQNR